MINLPKINGGVGIVLKAVGAVITGPAKIDGLKSDIAELRAEVKVVVGDMREIKGYLRGLRGDGPP